MTWSAIPHEISLEAERQQQLMGWPKLVPAYNEVLHADGIKRFGSDILGSSAVSRDFDYFRNSDQILGKAVDSSANPVIVR